MGFVEQYERLGLLLDALGEAQGRARGTRLARADVESED